ncbi:hypothetical protein FOZ62_008830, partial [Perkinsus olseni]
QGPYPWIQSLDPALGDKLYSSLGSASPIVPLDVYEDVNAIRKQRSSLSSSPVGRISVESSVLKLYDVLAVDHSIVTIDGKNGLEEKVYQGNCRKVEIGDTVPRAAEDPAEIVTDVASVMPSPTDRSMLPLDAEVPPQHVPSEEGPNPTAPPILLTLLWTRKVVKPAVAWVWPSPSWSLMMMASRSLVADPGYTLPIATAADCSLSTTTLSSDL